jgi:hypothetical protein
MQEGLFCPALERHDMVELFELRDEIVRPPKYLVLVAEYIERVAPQ